MLEAMTLADLYRSMTGDERRGLAQAVGVAPGYLWQIATRWRNRRPSIDLVSRLATADKRLSAEDLVKEFCE